MGDIFVACHSTITYFQHLGIVPMSRSGIRVEIGHLVYNVEYSHTSPDEYTLEAIAYVRSDAP